MSNPRYRTLEHTADIGLEIFGATMEELFANAALGFFDLVTEVEAIRESEIRSVVAAAGNREELLVRWLQELLFLFDTEKTFFRRVTIRKLTENRLEAEVVGEPFDPSRHTIRRTVKAVTYHSLSIREEAGALRATVIFDL